MNQLRREDLSSKTLREAAKKCPALVAFLAIACTVLAGLGDWKVLNNALGALPKAVAGRQGMIF